MSQATFAEEGFTSLLAALLDGALIYVHLYTNDPTIRRAMVAADFTEVAYDGYDSIAATRWTPPVLRGGVAWSVADGVIFTYTAGPLPSPVRGYYATAGKTGPVVWAWRRPGTAFQLNLDSPTLTVSVVMTFPALPGPDAP